MKSKRAIEKTAELDEQFGGDEEITLRDTPDGWTLAAEAA
jgi:hypothetical protein